MTQEELCEYSQPIVSCQLLSVEKKDYSWFFTFNRDVNVATESPWRLIEKDRIAVTSEDHGHLFGLPAPVCAASVATSSIVGCTVEAAAIFARSGDLIIEFNGSVQLQLLQMSCGYESWRLSSQYGQSFCTGGGHIVHFPNRP